MCAGNERNSTRDTAQTISPSPPPLLRPPPLEKHTFPSKSASTTRRPKAGGPDIRAAAHARARRDSGGGAGRALGGGRWCCAPPKSQKHKSRPRRRPLACCGAGNLAPALTPATPAHFCGERKRRKGDFEIAKIQNKSIAFRLTPPHSRTRSGSTRWPVPARLLPRNCPQRATGKDNYLLRFGSGNAKPVIKSNEPGLAAALRETCPRLRQRARAVPASSRLRKGSSFGACAFASKGVSGFH